MQRSLRFMSAYENPAATAASGANVLVGCRLAATAELVAAGNCASRITSRTFKLFGHVIRFLNYHNQQFCYFIKCLIKKLTMHILQHRLTWNGAGRMRRSALESNLSVEPRPLDTVPENPKDSIANYGSAEQDVIQMKPINEQSAENTLDQRQTLSNQLTIQHCPATTRSVPLHSHMHRSQCDEGRIESLSFLKRLHDRMEEREVWDSIGGHRRFRRANFSFQLKLQLFLPHATFHI